MVSRVPKDGHGYSHDATDPDSTEDSETKSGVKYAAHSMMQKGIVDVELTELEMSDGFEETGYKFSPIKSYVWVMITGPGWSGRRLLIHGSSSTEGVERYTNEIAEQVREIGHQAEQVGEVELSHSAVNGDFGESIESVLTNIRSAGVGVESEPEQLSKDFEGIDTTISRTSGHLS